MIPSIADQLAAFSQIKLEPPKPADPINNNRPTQADINKVARMLTDKRITARMVQAKIGKTISTSQAILRILCEEEGRARRVENGPRGEKGYVKA